MSGRRRKGLHSLIVVCLISGGDDEGGGEDAFLSRARRPYSSLAKLALLFVIPLLVFVDGSPAEAPSCCCYYYLVRASVVLGLVGRAAVLADALGARVASAVELRVPDRLEANLAPNVVRPGKRKGKIRSQF